MRERGRKREWEREEEKVWEERELLQSFGGVCLSLSQGGLRVGLAKASIWAGRRKADSNS